MRKKTIERIVLLLILTTVLSACTTTPPQRIQNAIQTMNRILPEYVNEANQALENTKHQDRERLIGIGERLANTLNVLNKWASEKEENERDSQTEQ